MHTKWLAAGCRTISRRKSGPSGSRTPPNASPSSAFGTPTLRTNSSSFFARAGVSNCGRIGRENGYTV